MSNDFETQFEREWEQYHANKRNELYPNIMLIGTSGAGKSSLINRIFGRYVANVSNVKPETVGFNIYKGRDYCKTVNLIDSAGYELGGADRYYHEIHNMVNRGIDGQSVHIIWYCIPITNERVQEMDMAVLKKLMQEANIRKRICIVFTKCDEDTKDSTKARALRGVLETYLGGYSLNYFETCADEEYELDLKKLIDWSAAHIDNEDLRNNFISAQMTDLEAKRKSADKIIAEATVAAAAIGASPIPFSDAALLVPVQVKMVGKIIDIYGVSSLAHISAKLISSAIISNIGKSVATSILKFIPVVGTIIGGAINAGVAAAITGAIGAVTSKICYKNVYDFLHGKRVDWETMFSGSDFNDQVKDEFLKRK